jgi:hypothetical protein
MEILKNELQDWWHEDFKEHNSPNPRKSQPDISTKKSLIESSKENTKRGIPGVKYLKKTFSMQQETFAGDADSQRARGSMELQSNEYQKNLNSTKTQTSMSNNKSHDKASTKLVSDNMTNFQTFDHRTNKKHRLEPLHQEKILIQQKATEQMDRPSTVNMPKSEMNERFKLRLSNNLDSILSRSNKRYTKSIKLTIEDMKISIMKKI